MDIKKLILETLAQKGAITTADLVKKTKFSRAYINRFLRELRETGQIVLIGKANRAHYVSGTQNAVLQAKRHINDITLTLKNQDLHEDTVLNDIKKKTGIFLSLKKNIAEIVEYAFLEMLNNAIEHSRATHIKISIKREESHIIFYITDNGVGIFNNIMIKKHLSHTLDAIHTLIKGKQTTAPASHTGEGIFFTSKAADLFMIHGSHKKLIFDNRLEDIFIKDIQDMTGTKVLFSIHLKSSKNLTAIFNQYTDGSYTFNKTQVTVKLYQTHSNHVSRSEARRLLVGLDKFKKIILDFTDVETIGQGFADEIFRIWKNAHPEITLEPTHANENVRFMILHVTRPQ